MHKQEPLFLAWFSVCMDERLEFLEFKESSALRASRQRKEAFILFPSLSLAFRLITADERDVSVSAKMTMRLHDYDERYGTMEKLKVLLKVENTLARSERLSSTYSGP